MACRTLKGLGIDSSVHRAPSSLSFKTFQFASLSFGTCGHWLNSSLTWWWALLRSLSYWSVLWWSGTTCFGTPWDGCWSFRWVLGCSSLGWKTWPCKAILLRITFCSSLRGASNWGWWQAMRVGWTPDSAISCSRSLPWSDWPIFPRILSFSCLIPAGRCAASLSGYLPILSWTAPYRSRAPAASSHKAARKITEIRWSWLGWLLACPRIPWRHWAPLLECWAYSSNWGECCK